MHTEQQTGMKDKDYDIISTLYHALKGIDITEQYIKDAEKEGDKAVVDFFQEVQSSNRRLADKAKELLSKRVH